MKANYHTHTFRCKHAGGTERDIVDAGIAAGLDELGFSEHIGYPDHDYGLRIDYDAIREYLTTIDRLQECNRGKIVLRKGFEAEYLPQYRDYYEKLLSDGEIDYLILGAHFCECEGGVTKNIFLAEDTDSYIDYAKNVAAGMATGIYKYAAHPDLFMVNDYGWDINCDRATDIILDAAVKNDVIIEYNANGIRRCPIDIPYEERELYPHRNFWERVRTTDLRVIVGSDSHGAEHLWDAYVAKAFRELENLGIKPLDHLDF